MENKAKSLLDLICEQTNCAYVSDLRSKEKYVAISTATQALLNGNFTENEWIEAGDYISQGRHTFTSAKTAKDYLLSLK